MKMGIRWQLVAITCLVVIVAFFALGILVRQIVLHDYRDKIWENDAKLAHMMEQNIYQALDTSVRVERNAASYPGLLNLPKYTQSHILQKVSTDNSWFELLAIVDMDGMQMARSTGTPGNRSSRLWYKEFMAKRKPVISGVYFSSSTSNLILTMVEPIGDPGGNMGMLMADIDTKTIQDYINKYNENGELLAYLIDQNGTAIALPGKKLSDGLYNFKSMTRSTIRRDEKGDIIYNADGNIALEEESFRVSSELWKIVMKAVSGENGRTKYTDVEDEYSGVTKNYGNRLSGDMRDLSREAPSILGGSGEIYLCTYRSIRLPGHSDVSWALIMARPYSTVLGALDGMLRQFIIVGLIIALLCSIGISLFSRRITKPLSEIAEASKIITEGNFAGKIDVDSQDEVGALAKAFNKMQAGLKEMAEKNKDAEEKIKHLAYHDALTGLPNRTHFTVYARQVISRSMMRQRHGAMLFVDVDKFKGVNDTYGHAAGDAVLVAFGKRLVEVVRHKEQVCRFGGDEFLVFLPGISEQEAHEIAGKLVEAMRKPFKFGDIELALSTSIGGACYQKDASGIDDLLAKADTALYTAKEGGRNQYRFYEKGMEEIVEDL